MTLTAATDDTVRALTVVVRSPSSEEVLMMQV